MADLYLDHDMPAGVGRLLSAAGHTVTMARELGLEAAYDYTHLLAASERQAILVTRNRKDFLALHGAWLAWTDAWGVTATHWGIIVVPHRHLGRLWSDEDSADRILELIKRGRPQRNELWRWGEEGWYQQP